MKKRVLKITSLILTLVIVIGCAGISSNAYSANDLNGIINNLEAKSRQLESQIRKLQNEKGSQQKLKDAIQAKINNTQAQINACNNEINKINTEIANNKALIISKNAEIESDKLNFKKRIRSIYMSNNTSNIKILLGAEDFSNYLQLSQLTAAVSSHDKAMIENLVAEIKVIEEKQVENQKLLDSQVEIRKTIAAKQAELEKEGASIQTVINSINKEQNDVKADNASVEKMIREYQNTLRSMQQNTGYGGAYDGGAFLWPVSGYYTISAGYASNDSVHKGKHYGIDIAGGGIAGKPVLAIADGYVYKSNSSCTHNYGKSSSCGCGGGYGNYVAIDHGTLNGTNYKAYYAHMSSITVSTGAYVKKGQVVGYVGTTGWSTGYHLHLGIMVNNSWVNPMNYYRKVN